MATDHTNCRRHSPATVQVPATCTTDRPTARRDIERMHISVQSQFVDTSVTVSGYSPHVRRAEPVSTAHYVQIIYMANKTFLPLSLILDIMDTVQCSRVDTALRLYVPCDAFILCID